MVVNNGQAETVMYPMILKFWTWKKLPQLYPSLGDFLSNSVHMICIYIYTYIYILMSHQTFAGSSWSVHGSSKHFPSFSSHLSAPQRAPPVPLQPPTSHVVVLRSPLSI